MSPKGPRIGRLLLCFLSFVLMSSGPALLHGVEAPVEAGSLAELARLLDGDGGNIRLKAGVYQMKDFLTAEVLEGIRAGVDRRLKRPPVPMLRIRGSNNRVDLRDTVIEIDTSLYALLPQGGYTRCLIVSGHGNTFIGLTLRNTGPEHGSGGNLLSLEGAGNTLQEATLYVHGSFPYGYGDLLGKGGPNLVRLEKQSGIQVLGSDSTLRRCKVYSRALGHCYYIQGGDRILIEDCYAEGAMRETNDMLRDTSGPAFDLGFRSVYENRDGQYRITPGYTKSLCEDGFRTYGDAGSVTLVNCMAVNTRAGFEIGAKDDAPVRTLVENCTALGCERAFLIGSRTDVRRCRGDLTYGPLLYLRGGRDSDIELMLLGSGPNSLVHAVATIAGENHRVHLSFQPGEHAIAALPIFLGYAMPMAAEMSSPIRPATTKGVSLRNEIPNVQVITSDKLIDCSIETKGRCLSDTELHASPGPWNLPANGIATGR